MAFWARLQEWFIGGARAQLTPHEIDVATRAGSATAFDEVVTDVLGATLAR